jgi:hypothetical protein
VLLTNLVNRAQPLLRYELTDSVTLAGGPNPLGLPYARIASVDGRSDDVVALRERAPADTPARVREALDRELRDAGALPPQIQVTVVPGIDRDPGHGAKFKLVRSTVPRA